MPLLLSLLLLAQDPSAPDAAPAAEPAVEAAAEPVAAPVTVVFIHGLYLNSSCWDQWTPVFEQAGYATLAPEWPGHAGKPADLRANIPAELNTLSFEQVLGQYRELVSGLDKPILVGHSMGGLIVQLLLQEGLGRAGVAIHSAPPKGVSSLAPSFLRANAPVLGKGTAPILLSPEQFHYGFLNHLNKAEAQAVYDATLVPEAKGVAQGPLLDISAVDWAKERAPLLIVAGSDDHVIPAGLNKKMFKKYGASPSRTDFVLMKGRTHGTLTQPGWEEVAKLVLDWVNAM